MKESVFIKKNVFTCLMFGSIFLFILYASIYTLDNLSVIAFIIAVPIFILSLIKLIIDILEDLNNKITLYLYDFEKYKELTWEDLDLIRLSNNKNFRKNIQNVAQKYPENSLICDELNQYFSARRTRRYIRLIRRIILYMYYLIFMLVFVLLLLHSELYSLLTTSDYLNSLNMDLFTVWSLVIILFEIMMKDIFEDVITYLLGKMVGINLQYY